MGNYFTDGKMVWGTPSLMEEWYGELLH